MVKVTTANFRKGKIIQYRDEPYQIIDFKHKTHGRGMAHIWVRLKNLKTGYVQEDTYKSGEIVEEVLLDNRPMQYLYQEGNQFYFMDNVSFEQIAVNQETLNDNTKYLKENDTYQLTIYEGSVIGIKIPKKIKLKVTETEAAVKGNTVTAATKPAKLETGMVVQVPLFVKSGDQVYINTETSEYVERANE